MNTTMTRRAAIRLSVENPKGKRRRVAVEIDRSPADTDKLVMERAAAEYRRLFGFTNRVVAIYVANP